MGPLRGAVIGAGHWGRIHARKYAAHPGVHLTAVVDRNGERAAEVAAACGAVPFTDHRAVLGHIDVASVAVPVTEHFVVGRDLIAAGVHVLMEKPITTDLDQAVELIELADVHRCVLKTGHVERFNPVVQALCERAGTPIAIEAHRLGPATERGTDVDVVLDLMIHDIDLTLMVVGAPVTHIEAIGTPVYSSQVDVATAQICFADGCTATLTASRASTLKQRRFRVLRADATVCADLTRHVLDWRGLTIGDVPDGLRAARGDHQELVPGDALGEEVRAFLAQVTTGQEFPVTATDSLRALATALDVGRLMEHRRPWERGLQRVPVWRWP